VLDATRVSGCRDSRGAGLDGATGVDDADARRGVLVLTM
jgi:hypothetical protein